MDKPEPKFQFKFQNAATLEYWHVILRSTSFWLHLFGGNKKNESKYGANFDHSTHVIRIDQNLGFAKFLSYYWVPVNEQLEVELDALLAKDCAVALNVGEPQEILKKMNKTILDFYLANLDKVDVEKDFDLYWTTQERLSKGENNG